MSKLEDLGVTLTYDFITIEEELELLSKIKKNTPKKTKSRNSIQRYGSTAPYNSNMVSKTIPDYLDNLSDKLVANGFLEVKPNSVAINEYCTGQEITPHIDSKNSGEIITVLSLMSEATMVLTHKTLKHNLILPPRSIVQMRGESRNVWKHSINPVPSTRYSIVFRLG